MFNAILGSVIFLGGIVFLIKWLNEDKHKPKEWSYEQPDSQAQAPEPLEFEDEEEANESYEDLNKRYQDHLNKKAEEIIPTPIPKVDMEDPELLEFEDDEEEKPFSEKITSDEHLDTLLKYKDEDEDEDIPEKDIDNLLESESEDEDIPEETIDELIEIVNSKPEDEFIDDEEK